MDGSNIVCWGVPKLLDFYLAVTDALDVSTSMTMLSMPTFLRQWFLDAALSTHTYSALA